MAIPGYSKDHLPMRVENMRRYQRKPTIVPMFYATGPLVVLTQGNVKVILDKDWRGFIAIDSAGHPYPLAEDEHAEIYTEVPYVRDDE